MKSIKKLLEEKTKDLSIDIQNITHWIGRVCLTCGCRNNQFGKDNYCKHNNCLQRTDFVGSSREFVVEKAMKVFGMTREQLLKEFITNKSFTNKIK